VVQIGDTLTVTRRIGKSGVTSRSKQQLAGAMSIAAVGIAALAFVPLLRGASAVFWLAALVMFGTAFATAVVGTRRRVRTVLVSTTAFVASVATGFAVVQALSAA
jgi:hypothetical protein